MHAYEILTHAHCDLALRSFSRRRLHPAGDACLRALLLVDTGAKSTHLTMAARCP